jgi:hypothetical protein
MPHVIPTKIYRKNFRLLRFSMYNSFNVNTEKMGQAQALPFGSARRELLRGGTAGEAKVEPSVGCPPPGRYRNYIRSRRPL